MSTLAEIEAAADSLPAEQQEELLRHLAVRLRKETPLPRKAAEWLQTARGLVRVGEGETAEDVRAGYYAAKYGVKP